MNKVLAGNWKMNKNRAEVKSFFEQLPSELKTNNKARAIVAPSPTLMETAVLSAAGSVVEVFSQNCAFEGSGAYTGEISPMQLQDIGVTGTLVGHSERRQYFGETDASCLKRTLKAFESGLTVIYCIGETLEERKSAQTNQVLARQLQLVVSEVLPHLPAAEGAKERFIVAYEPVWAIGTGLTASAQDIKNAHDFIYLEMSKASSKVPSILYGGSVKPENFAEISSTPHVAGGLVGGAALKSADYSSLWKTLLSK